MASFIDVRGAMKHRVYTHLYTQIQSKHTHTGTKIVVFTGAPKPTVLGCGKQSKSTSPRTYQHHDVRCVYMQDSYG